MKKPAKPYPDFPLYAHANGQWAKKIAGRNRYYGKWSEVDWREALAEYHKTRDAYQAGRDPADFNNSVDVAYVCNLFLTEKSKLVESGDLSHRSLSDYKRTAKKVVEFFGRSRSAASLTPSDFSDFRKRLAKQLGPVALGNDVNRTRSIFKYAYDTGLIATPIRFGPDFKKPGGRQMRLNKAAQTTRLFTADEIRHLIDTASQPLKSMILLGINAALGNADCGRLKWSHLDLYRGWLHFPRPKTGVDRRAKLWGKTCEALLELPRDSAGQNSGEDLVFVTKYGNSWHKETSSDNPITKEFRKLLEECKLHQSGRGFYALRHTFETEAGASIDQAAVDHIMGHEPQHMAAVYRHGIQETRLESVSEQVFRWLFGDQVSNRVSGPYLRVFGN